MPIYEYRCDACGHELEALQKLSEDPLRDCPECEDDGLRRLISAPAFRLKGDGWYETDFKSEKETKRNLVDGASADEKSDSKSEDAKKADKGKDDAKESSGEKSSKEKPAKKANLSSDKKSSGSAAA